MNKLPIPCDPPLLDLAQVDVYVINLEESRSRWIQCFRRLGGVFDKARIKRVPAIDGRLLSDARAKSGWDEIFRIQLQTEGYLGDGRSNILDPVRTALCLSHQRALRMFLDEAEHGGGGERWVLILEDDARPAESLLGSPTNASTLRIPSQAEVLFLHDRVTIGPSLVPEGPDGGDYCGTSWGAVTGGIGLEAYLVSPEGAKKMLAAWRPLYFECDIQLMAFMEHFADAAARERIQSAWKRTENQECHTIACFAPRYPLFQVDDVPSVKLEILEDVRRSRVDDTGETGLRTETPQRLVFDLLNPLAFATCWFNPAHYRSRLENLLVFLDRLGDCNLVVLELAFGDDDWQLPDDIPNLVRLRTDTVCWQKEALLNHGMGLLDSFGFQYLGWLDADVVFEQPHWQERVTETLEKRQICQVFESVETSFPDRGLHRGVGAAAGWLRHRTHPLRCENPGFGWAMRSKVWRAAKLYDTHVLGGGDGVMWRSAFYESLGADQIYAADAYPTAVERTRNAWAATWSKSLKLQLGVAAGISIKALPHGRMRNRQYLTRGKILDVHAFDPAVHCVRDDLGLIKWSAQTSPALREAVASYFTSRKEDS